MRRRLAYAMVVGLLVADGALLGGMIHAYQRHEAPTTPDTYQPSEGRMVVPNAVVRTQRVAA